MTRDDVLALEPGDSVIGANNCWDDELPVMAVGEPIANVRGQLLRPIHVRRGRTTLRAIVHEGDATIRGARI